MKKPKIDEFVDSMIKLLESSPALMHLDISGMFIGDDGVGSIMMDGVALSKTLAGVHLQDNNVSHWTRMRIFARLTMGVRPSDTEVA